VSVVGALLAAPPKGQGKPCPYLLPMGAARLPRGVYTEHIRFAQVRLRECARNDRYFRPLESVSLFLGCGFHA
jgi:hypothetical protein